MEIRVFNPSIEIKEVRGLIAGYKYHVFRNYPRLDKIYHEEYLLAQLYSLAEQEGSRVFIALENGRVKGIVSLDLLDWDTQHFGIKIGRIDHLIAADEYKESIRIKNGLLNHILSVCAHDKFIHLSCSIDIDDISSLHVLENNGFKTIDTIVAFAFKHKRQKIPNIRSIYKVREYKNQDLCYLEQLARDSFLEHRFHRDILFSKNKSDSLYSEWVKNSAKEGSIFVATKDNKPVGFFTYKLYKDFAAISNYKIMGKDALMAVDPSAKGAVIGLLKTTIEDVMAHYDCAEYCTLLSNRQVMRIFQTFNFEIVRSNYTLHKWIKFENREKDTLSS